MRRKFLAWLFAVICTVFSVTVLLAYAHFTRHAEERAAQTMNARLTDLMELIHHAEDGARHVMMVNDASALQRTRALAEMLCLRPELLRNQEALQGVCNELGAEQISITDAQGIVRAAVPATGVGYNLGEHEQSREFLACIADPDKEICQRPALNGQEHLMMQYAGVHRKDAPGVVQIGVLTAHEQALRNNASFGKLAANFRLGDHGHIIAFRDGAVLDKGGLIISEAELLSLPRGVAREVSLNGERYYAYAMEDPGSGYLLVGLMPVSDMYVGAMRSVRSILFSNLALFVMMFVVVSYLLQYYVVRSIRRVNDSLRRIKNGDLNERVDVSDTPEMARLSTDMNAMVDTLQFYAEEKRESMKRELELARTIQMSAMPTKFPPFPNREEFDLYAVCSPALTVGGDYYDFFLIDPNHLGFLVADCSDNGIPAALYMMRCISVTRSLARAGAPPATLMTEANAALCEGNTGELSMSLFYGCLEIDSGRLSYVNAGAPQALLQHEGGAFERLSMISGMVMGVYEAAQYTQGTLQLQPGDRLFLYTAGVLEAADAENTPFGEMRLQEALGGSAARISDVPLMVRSALRRFMQDAEQREDITMLALEYRGHKRREATREVTAGGPEGVDEMLDAQLEAVFAAPNDIADMKATTAAVLAALAPETRVQVCLRCDEHSAELSFRYAGSRHNPMISLPHLPVNDVRYTYDKENLLTLKKALA